MLTLPVSGLEMPVWPAWPTILDPPIRHPIIAPLHRHPAPCHPDVLTALPAPIAWCPDVAGTWRGDHFDLGLWRSDVNIQIEIDSGNRRGAQHCQRTQCHDHTL